MTHVPVLPDNRPPVPLRSLRFARFLGTGGDYAIPTGATAHPYFTSVGVLPPPAPSTVHPLARDDPRVLIGWPFPLGFGLDGRLLLARRGRFCV